MGGEEEEEEEEKGRRQKRTGWGEGKGGEEKEEIKTNYYFICQKCCYFAFKNQLELPTELGKRKNFRLRRCKTNKREKNSIIKPLEEVNRRRRRRKFLGFLGGVWVGELYSYGRRRRPKKNNDELTKEICNARVLDQSFSKLLLQPQTWDASCQF